MGHGWQWVTKPLVQRMEDEAPDIFPYQECQVLPHTFLDSHMGDELAGVSGLVGAAAGRGTWQRQREGCVGSLYPQHFNA